LEGGRTPEELARQISRLESRLQELLDFLPDALIEGRLPEGPVTGLNRMARVAGPARRTLSPWPSSRRHSPCWPERAS
jgi:hypothetical protein